MSQVKKTFFLTRKMQFVECRVTKETGHKRVIEILEGEMKGKYKSVHPEGISYGKLFPRVFENSEKPDSFFVFKGRVLMSYKEKTPLVPEIDVNYRFQPWLSHVIDNINIGENTVLTGGTGVGKTTAIVQLAARINQPVVRINFNAETRISDLLGKIQVRNGETIWQDGVLPLAMRNGYWIILDELDGASPEILSLLNPVLETNPHLTLKENGGEVIIAHPKFRVIATGNTLGCMIEKAGSYAGTNQMNIALMDRFHLIAVPNLPFKEEIKLVKSKVRGIRNRWAVNMVKFANAIRSGNSEINFNDNNFSTRMLLAWAKRSALLNNPIHGAEISWMDKIPTSEKETVMSILVTYFGNKERKKSDSKLMNADGLVLKKKRGRPRKIQPVAANA